MFSSLFSRLARRPCASDKPAPFGGAAAKSTTFPIQFMLGAAFGAVAVLAAPGAAAVRPGLFIDVRAPNMDGYSIHRLPRSPRLMDMVPVDPMITGATPKPPKFGVLGSLEFKTDRVAYQSAWSSLVSRVTREWPSYIACRQAKSDCPRGLRRWQELIRSVRDLPSYQQLQRINPAINNMARYADDSTVYGARDYWASPREFVDGRADCEDYAVIKFYSLIQLGFAARQLRIVVVKDTQRGVLHAVLTVELAGKIYVMDSLRSQPVEHQFALRYEPISSINTEGRWAHVVTPQIRSQFMAQVENPSVSEVPDVRPQPVAEAQSPIVESTLYRPHVAPKAATV